MSWIDSHCHVQWCKDGPDAVIDRARAAGVLGMIVVGTCLVYGCGGAWVFHRPIEAGADDNTTISALLSIAGVAYAVLLALHVWLFVREAGTWAVLRPRTAEIARMVRGR